MVKKIKKYMSENLNHTNSSLYSEDLAPVSAEKMAEYIVDFAMNANQWIKGKIIPVSLSTP